MSETYEDEPVLDIYHVKVASRSLHLILPCASSNIILGGRVLHGRGLADEEQRSNKSNPKQNNVSLYGTGMLPV